MVDDDDVGGGADDKFDDCATGFFHLVDAAALVVLAGFFQPGVVGAAGADAADAVFALATGARLDADDEADVDALADVLVGCFTQLGVELPVCVDAAGGAGLFQGFTGFLGGGFSAWSFRCWL